MEIKTVDKEKIQDKIYINNQILERLNKQIDSIDEQIKSGTHIRRKDALRSFEIRDLNKLLSDLKKAKKRVEKLITKLQKLLRR